MDGNESPERINFSIKGVPKEWFEQEFKPNAFEYYNDTYVLKIMHDHEIAQTLAPRFERLLNEIEELKALIKETRG